MSHGLSGPDLQKAYEGALRGNLSPEEEEDQTEEPETVAEEDTPDGDQDRDEYREEYPERYREEDQDHSEDQAEDADQHEDLDELTRADVAEEEGQTRTHATVSDEIGIPPEVREAGPVMRAADRARRARMRRRIVEETMETKEVEQEDLFITPFDTKEEVPANDTWGDLLEKCEWEEERAIEELKDVVYHTEGRPEKSEEETA